MKKARYALIGAVCVTIGLVAGCSKSLDSTSVQDKLQAGLVQQFGGDYTVTCPSSIPVQSGGTFDCDVVNKADNSTAKVTVTQTDDQGNLTWVVASVNGQSAAPSDAAPSDAASPAAS